MEEVSSSSDIPLSGLGYFNRLLLRPLLAIAFVLFLIILGWFLAWKLVLVHVPLVQEIFGLRKKTSRPKPTTGRLSKIYSNIESDARKSSSS
ncbi:uncharacterized protein LOC133802334 [Humulus lupulus]|uniref:uncharacterized protein LOC133802334 n=1 Tax=Humulus lupulus TaxID=3486 RepID=UPI002B408BA8|nr:uncharacterized protein LOC133802334 [Humulus lupulus]